jgi:hypothetical protein
MGYLIKEAKNDLVKVETIISAADMQTLHSAPYTLTSTIKTGFIFYIVSATIQVNGSAIYNNWTYLWIWQGGGINKAASMVKSLGNTLVPSAGNTFAINVDVNFGVVKYGTFIDPNRDYILEMNVDDPTGDGKAVVTLYGIYVPTI